VRQSLVAARRGSRQTLRGAQRFESVLAKRPQIDLQCLPSH
jgi:hypothetical protein